MKVVYNRNPDNTKEVVEFIGEQPECAVCGGTGEYEKDGPRGCDPCNSRLIFFIDANGKRVGADWGDTILKNDEGGLELITNSSQSLN